VKTTHKRIKPRSGPWTPTTQLVQEVVLGVAIEADVSTMAFLVSLIAREKRLEECPGKKKQIGGKEAGMNQGEG
jgi:hypothetical protein